MIRAWCCVNGKVRDVTPDEIPELVAAAEPRPLLWVDIEGPDEAETRLLLETFRFHPLAVEDTRNQRQRPKAEEYPDHLFLILNPAVAASEGSTPFRELDVFLSRDYLVTVHPGPEPTVDAARRRVKDGMQLTTAHMLYALLDTVVDSYFPILDELQDRLEDLEEQLVSDPSRFTLTRLFNMKRNLIEFRRVVGPQRDMFNLLMRRDLPFIELDQLQYHLRDVYDHLLRITDMADSYRDLLTSSIDLYMSSVSNRLNQVVNRLTIVTVLVGSLGVVVGFYGMNFERTWPPFGAWWGVPATLGFMTLIIMGGLWLFRRFRIL